MSIYSGIRSATWQTKAFLTMGAMTGSWLMSWRSSFSTLSSPTQPAIRITGALESRALAIPERALVNPGPAVTMATAGLRVILAQASAMKTAACS